MDVSGQGATSQGKGSDNADLLCNQCSESGQIVIAAGFCRTCPDYLCRQCITQHKKLRATKEHDILDGADMPSMRSAFTGAEYCVAHPERQIEMFCHDEDTLGCTLCFVLEHKSCQNVGLVSELSKDFENSQQFLEIMKLLGKHKQLVERYKYAIQHNRAMNDTYHSESIQAFKRFRLDVDTLLDKMEKKVLNEAGSLKRDNDAKLHTLEEMVTSFNKEVESYMKHIKVNQKHKQKDQLFILAKKHMSELNKSVKTLEELGDNININKFSFLADNSVIQLISKEPQIRVETESAATTCTAVSQINTKSSEDIVDCTIVGLVQISGKELVCIDFKNKCLKVVDVETYTISKRRQLAYAPHDITLLPRSLVAVTLPAAKQIHLHTTDADLNHCGSIDVDGMCLGLHCTGNNMIVSYIQPVPHVQILDMTGRVLKTIQHDASGAALFTEPRYLAYSPGNNRIYISDLQKDAINCITTEGEVQWTYMDQDLKHPEGVVIGDDGCVYICASESHSIHVVSAGGEKLAVISQDQTGAWYPRAGHYCSVSQTLYLSSGSKRPDEKNFIRRLTLM